MDATKLLEAALLPLASGDREIFDALKAVARLRSFDPHQVIVIRDAGDTEVYCMLEGRGRIVVHSDEGHEIWIDDLGPGDLFGEMAALGAMRRSAEVSAVTEAVVAAFAARDFLRLLERHGKLGMEISRRLIARLLHTTQRMYELSALSAPGRVYAELLRSAKFESGRKEVGVIRPVPRVAELARRVHSTRETASRSISDLEHRGLLIRAPDHMIVLAPTRLGF